MVSPNAHFANVSFDSKNYEILICKMYTVYIYIFLHRYIHTDLTVPYYIFGTFGFQFPIYQVAINLLELEDEGICVYIYI